MEDERRSRLATFVAELRRRHVGRVAIAYGAATFVLLQAGEIILPAFDAPVFALRMLVVLVLLGFPIALAFAWVYEITPRGIRRTPDLEPLVAGRDRPGRLLPRLAFLGVTLVTAAAIGWWIMKWEPSEGEFSASSADARLPSGVVRAAVDPDAPIRSLVVLPFEDFSTEPQPEFAAGMQDALILQLSQIEALRVVSSTSAMRYAGTALTVPEIGRELGVQAVVEGSVTKVGDRVYASQGDYEGAVAVHQARAAREGAAAAELEAARQLKVGGVSPRDYWAWKLAQLNATSERGGQVSHVSYAAALCALGEHDDAIDHLERAYEERDRRLASLWSDPIWDPLRDEPRFRGLIRKIRSTRWRMDPPPPP